MFTDPYVSTEAERSFLMSAEQVLMQTALANTVNLKTSMKQPTRLSLDCGSQRTYTSEDLVEKLQLRLNNSEIVTVFTFGSTKPKEFKPPVVEFVCKLRNETDTKGTQSCFRSMTALFKISSRKKTLRKWMTKLKKGQ